MRLAYSFRKKASAILIANVFQMFDVCVYTDSIGREGLPIRTDAESFISANSRMTRHPKAFNALTAQEASDLWETLKVGESLYYKGRYIGTLSLQLYQRDRRINLEKLLTLTTSPESL